MFLFWCESGTDTQQQIVCPFYVVTEYPPQLIFHFLPPNTVFSGLSEVAGFLTAANFRSFVSGNVYRQKYNSLSCTGELACNSCSQTGLFSSDYLLLLCCSDVGGRLLLSRNFFHQVYHLFSLFISKAPLILLFSPHNSLL